MAKRSASSRRRPSAQKQSTPASYRVNARLDAEAREKLTLLEIQTGLSTSDVLRAAVSQLFASRVAEGAGARSSLDKLVGKFSGGPRHLSENYKRSLTESLAEKHGGS